MKLKIENLCVTFARKSVLDHLDLAVEKGSFVSVLGPSGCGKSTLLKTIAGVVPNCRGNIFIDGKNVNSLAAHKRKTVIVFQDIRLFPHMNVEENIAFPLKMKGVRREHSHSKVAELLERVQLSGFAARNIDQLSGGQQQRIALARALAAEPEILLLDEPFSGLDENLRFDMTLLLLELHKAYDMTTVMVTHDKQEALSLSDCVVIMEDGRILQTGSPRDVYQEPANYQVAKYFGNATFVKGTVCRGTFEAPEFSLPCPLPEGEYLVMIRSDALTIVAGTEYRVKQVIFAGRQQELLLEHTVTGQLLRCQYDQDSQTIDDRVSIQFNNGRLRFFPIE